MTSSKPDTTIAAMMGRYLSYGPNDTISSRLESMVNNEFCSDVTFIVGKERRRIYAHKLLLVGASEYFYAMFYGNFVEADRREVTLEDIEPDMLLLILRYIYCLKVEISMENVRDLFDCAQKYMLRELHQQIGQFLYEQAKSANALSIFTSNRYYSYPELDEACLEMIRNNPLYYFNHVDFVSIDRETLFKIFTSPAINCTDDQLGSALEIWEEANREDNTEELRRLVKQSKRSYNCLKLLVFGQSMNEGFVGTADPMHMTLLSDNPLSLYGLGVYIMSKANVVSVEMKIYDENIEVSSDVFEFPNSSVRAVHVADLFFEEVVMMPQHRYRIEIKTSPQSKHMISRNLHIYHETISFGFPYFSNDRNPIAVAHLFCNERDQELKKE
uniref:BTB domain-containing protein n=1 Tax=Anopheles epiroticus TaxID=199890 RepID=A0A182P192_9DIPT